MRRERVNDLLLLVATGDRQALADLYATTSSKLFEVVLRVLANRSDAEEVLQEVYVRIWLRSGRFRRSDLSPMSWLITVARNLAIDAARRRSRSGAQLIAEAEAEDWPDPGATPEAEAHARSLRARVATGLRNLPTTQAEALIAAYVHDERHADLAARFGVPVSTVRSQLRRNLHKLRARLEDEGITRG